MKVNFNFDVPSSTLRPTGVPYVYSDITTRPFTRRPAQSHHENFNTRFGARPTPQMVREQSTEGNNERVGSITKDFDGNSKNNEIDSIRGSRYFGPSKMSLFNLAIHSLSIIGVFKYTVFLRSTFISIPYINFFNLLKNFASIFFNFFFVK